MCDLYNKYNTKLTCVFKIMILNKQKTRPQAGYIEKYVIYFNNMCAAKS